MSGVQEFFARQRALADMSDEDMDEYETRTRGALKRRKLWNSDENPSGPSSQGAREGTYNAGISNSLSPRGSSTDVSRDIPPAQRGRDDNFQREDAACGGPTSLNSGGAETFSLSTPTPSHAQTYTDMRVDLTPSGSSDWVNSGGLKKAIRTPSRHDQTPPSPSPDAAPHPSSRLEGVANNHVEHLPRDQEYHRLDSGPDPEPVKHLKDHQVDLQERVQKKSGVSNSNVPKSSADSNVTSPSATPLTRSNPSHLIGRLRGRPTLETERKARKTEKAKKEAQAAARKKDEEEEKRMTPSEYAVKVQKKFAPLLERASEENLFLKDKVIFYVGGDYKYASKSTRNRMDFLRKKGAVVVPTYDPDKVTHIVTDARKGTTLEALQIKSLDEIPIHIPTVTWEWVTSGNKGSLDIEFLHAAFPSRIEASPGKNLVHQNAKVKGKAPASPLLKTFAGDEFSRIEDFTVAEHTTPYRDSPMPRPKSMPKGNPHATTSKVQLPSNISVPPVKDPLAEFYAQAKRDRDAKPMREYKKYEQESDDDSPLPLTIAAQKPGFTCDQKGVNVGPCPNQDIVDKLSELSELHKSKLGAEEHWRVFSYGKSIRAIRNYPTRIRSYEEAKAIKDVGKKTALKIKEIIETGELKRIEHENTEDVRVINVFNDIYDVGPSTAYKWYASGCRTLEDVKQRKGGITLSPAQEIGLRFYDDINTRIPREEVSDIFRIIKTIALEIDPKLFFEIMGSYRRGRETCGDVDILLTRPTDDGRTHRGVLRRLLKELHLRGILTEDLAVPDLDELEGSYRGLCRLNETSRRRRIDILVVRYESRGAALIYYTGDDIFNRAIRYKAGTMGFSLSQRALYSNVVRDPSDRRRKTARGIAIASETEEEIFRILGVPWQEPHERVRA